MLYPLLFTAVTLFPLSVNSVVVPVPEARQSSQSAPSPTMNPPQVTLHADIASEPVDSIIASIEANGLETASNPPWLASAMASPVPSQTGTPPPVPGLPIPTGSPLEYPNPGDCNNVDSNRVSGPQKWKNANANQTLGCFKSLIMEAPFWDGMEPFDEQLARYYGFSNPNFQCSIDPTTPQAECQDDNPNCESLQPLPLQPMPHGGGYGYACAPNLTELHHKATGWVLRQSMINLNAYFSTVQALFQNATTNVQQVTGPNGQFKDDFTEAAIDTTPTKRIGLAVMNGVMGMAYAGTALMEDFGPQTFMIGMAYSLGATGASIGMANASDTVDQPDLQGWLGNLTSVVSNAYESFSDSIFRKGYVISKPWLGAPGANISLFDLIDGGKWAGQVDFGGQNQTATDLFEQGIYAALAQRSWISQDNTSPFISVWPGDCTDASKLPHNFTLSEMQGTTVDWTDISTSIDGVCYSLLGAQGSSDCTAEGPIHHEKRQTLTPISQCCAWEPLQGGSKKLLSGGPKAKYAGLKLTDMIESAVAGWKLNKKANGYTPWNVTMGSGDQPVLPTNLSSPGIVSAIPICDYSTPLAPGLDCPNLYTMKPGCAF